MASIVRRARNLRWVTALLWAGAVFAFLGGSIAIVHSATFPRAIASHPVRAEATVTESYINGFGGDPGVSYQYRVAGHEYKGSGNGDLGHEQVSNLRPGDPVAIEYAAGDPGESCTCNAARDAPESTSSAAVLAGVLSLPLLILVGRRTTRPRFVRPTWFEPVHGFGEWVGFIGGLAVALVFGLIVLAYFVAAAVQP
jgi:hypothetical protein